MLHKAARRIPPAGVIGVICPWNFPFHNIFCPVVPALFAGNAVVAKVSGTGPRLRPPAIRH